MFNRESGRRESKKAFETRVKWKELGFPSFSIFVSETDFSISTIEKYSSVFGWHKVKDEYVRLLAEVKAEKKQEEINKMEDEYGKIWESIRDSFKERVSNLNNRISDSSDDFELKEVFKEYNDLIRNLEQIQKNERINSHLPNAYKETEKIKMEQSGNLNIGFSEQTLNLFEKMKQKRKEL